MNYETPAPTAVDRLVSNLCATIDRLTADVEYYKTEAEYWHSEYSKLLNQQIAHGRQMMGNALLFAMHIKDTPDGLLIDKPEELAERIGRIEPTATKKPNS